MSIWPKHVTPQKIVFSKINVNVQPPQKIQLKNWYTPPYINFPKARMNPLCLSNIAGSIIVTLISFKLRFIFHILYLSI